MQKNHSRTRIHVLKRRQSRRTRNRIRDQILSGYFGCVYPKDEYDWTDYSDDDVLATR